MDAFDPETEWRRLAEGDPFTRPDGYEYDASCFYCHADEGWRGTAYLSRVTSHPDTCAWVRARRHFELPQEYDGEAYEVYDHRLTITWEIRQAFAHSLGLTRDDVYRFQLVEVTEIEDPDRGPALRYLTSDGDQCFITVAEYERLMGPQGDTQT